MELLHFRSVEVGFIEPLHPFSNFRTSEVVKFSSEKTLFLPLKLKK